MKRTMPKLFAIAMILAMVFSFLPGQTQQVQAAGTVSLTAFGASYNQDFNTLASSGTSSTVPTGWDFSETGANANTTYTAGTGSSNAGDTYSFGATDDTERAFGGLRSGNLIPLVGAQFTNNIDGTITSLAISYTGEQWRLGQNTAGRAADRLDFQLSTNATSLSTGTWTDYDALDFSSPVVSGIVGTQNGNVSPNRTALSFTITGLSISNGAAFWIRWADSDLIPGADDGLSIDDFSFTPSGNLADVAPEVSSTAPFSGETGISINSNIGVIFSETVNVSGSWFGVSCGTSGPHPAIVSGGPTTFTLDPDTDFVNGETCTVTVFAAQVEDQDLNDPPNLMIGDYAFSFETTAPISSSVIINEVDSDTPGTDALEFVELFDGGVGNTSLNGLVVVFYNGSNDLSYAAFDLDGFSTDSNGYFLLGNSGVNPTPSIIFSGNTLQNGQDAVALYKGDAIGFPIGTGVKTTNLIDALVYDTNDADDPGLLVLLNASQPQVDEAGGGDSASQSNQRCPNGSGGARNTDTYTQNSPTPGAENCPPPPPEACGDPFTPIYNVQGSGAVSPLANTEVAIEGVVVGDFQNNSSPDNGNLNGFHVQDPTGDDNAATSDGVFVYALGGMDVAVGDGVRVRGSISEYYGLTEITASQIWLCSSDNSVAATTLSLPVTSVDDFEAYEGMLVTFPQDLYISEYFNFDRYNEIVLTSQRHLTPTAEVEPGPDAIQAAQDFLLDKITLDDGRSAQNPDPAIHPNGNVFDLTNLFRGGDILKNVTGVMDYSFDLYRIQPTQGADYTAANPRPAEPDDVGGNLKVASFNLLNYFSTIDTGAFICGPLQDQECRGADTPEEFTRQRDKIIAAIIGTGADVVGMLEMENDVFDAALQDLVAGLNSVSGTGTYDYVDTGVIGMDAIKVVLIYKPASVSLVGDYTILDSTIDERFIDTKNRPTLAQSFMDNTTGGIFTVAINHLKSKGSDCGISDPDTGDGAGNCNITRTLAAQALVDWLASDPTGSGDGDFLIIGDLNSYDKEDPIDAIEAGPDDVLGTTDDYTDMVFEFQGEDAYSYVFDGQLGYLDHALASATLAGQITGVTDWHINADEPDLIDYDMSLKKPAQAALYAPDPYRSSDHDPVIIGLDLSAYAFSGFFQPIDNTPTYNLAIAGSVVPVKFSLGGNQGLGVFADGYPISMMITCPINVGTDDIEETVTAGKSKLKYDSLTDQYIYTWKTDKAWAGTCRQLIIMLNDGIIRIANFQFK